MLQYESVNAQQRQYRGMFDTLLKIYKYEGVRGLYKVTSYYQYICDDWPLQFPLPLLSPIWMSCGQF